MKKPSDDPWFVYMLRCADGSLYTGIAKDVEARFAWHAAFEKIQPPRARHGEPRTYVNGWTILAELALLLTGTNRKN